MTVVQGCIERINFRNENTGFAIARVEPSSGDEPAAAPFTALGNLGALHAGEVVELHGEWVIHPAYGRQFRVEAAHAKPPVGTEAVARYLGSGAIKGVGVELARRIIGRFGAAALDVIERHPERLADVSGIGPRRAEAIRSAVLAQRAERRTLLFLQELQLGPGLAAAVRRRYGEESERIVRENPYRLAQELRGVGFRTADQIAQRLGIGEDHPGRSRAAIDYLLAAAADEGHVYLPRAELIARCEAELTVPADAAADGLEALGARGRVIIEGEGEGAAVYAATSYRLECEAAARLTELLAAPPSPLALPEPLSPLLAAGQREAVEAALRAPLLVVTGGPGTGKTTLIAEVCRLLERRGERFALAAPTGRAAQRLKEATGREARTLHRLLEFEPAGGELQFARDQDRPLELDCLIVDECSMLDLSLFVAMLRAVGRARLVLVGDADQLPSVGAGNVLADLLAAPRVPRLRLTEVFRQDERSGIVLNAHRLLAGEMPVVRGYDDFFFIPVARPEAAQSEIVGLVKNRLPSHFGLDPMREIQVLAPVRRGPAGIDALNDALQSALNPARPGEAEVEVAEQRLRAGDRVMQIRNAYDLEWRGMDGGAGRGVFNGELGRIQNVDANGAALDVEFDGGRRARLGEAQLQDLQAAYAMTIHKSQGSEFEAVVMPVFFTMPQMMSRQLFYTAVTRARRLVVLVGRPQALSAYVRNWGAPKRYTGLAARLTRIAHPSGEAFLR